MTGDLKQAVFAFEVPFYDVDSYRIVWHGNYPKYFEQARCKLLRQLGVPYPELEKMGYFYPVVDMRIKYVKPLVFEQSVQVTATLKHWHHKLTIDYRIHDADTGDVLTKASTDQVPISPEGVTLFDAPRAFLDKIEQALNDG